MDRLWKLFRYDPEIDYEDEFEKSSFTEELCNKVVPAIIRDNYERLTSKRFDFVVSYTDEFKEDLFDQAKSAADAFKRSVESNTSLSDTQRRHAINWVDIYLDLVKRTIEKSIAKLYMEISSFPGDGLHDCLYYNIWGDKYDGFRKDSISTIGANDEQRGSFDREYNEKLFDAKYNEIKSDTVQPFMMLSESSSSDFESCIRIVRPFLQNLFQDYIKRFSLTNPSLQKIENAGLGWLHYTFQRCDHLEWWEFGEKVYSTQVTKTIIDEMKKNFLADIERRIASEVPAQQPKKKEDAIDVFRKLEDRRDTQIRRKVEEQSVLKNSHSTNGLKRGRVYFNLWGKDYYEYATPLFKMNPLPDSYKPLIDRVSNANYFSQKLAGRMSLFDGTKDIRVDPIVGECSEHLIQMLNEYMDYVATEEAIYAEKFVSEGISWCEASDYAIKQATQSVIDGKKPISEVYNRDIRAIDTFLRGKIYGSLTQLIIDHSKFYGWDVEFIMPYNMVGDSFTDKAESASKKLIQNQTEFRFVDYTDNTAVFMAFFGEILSGVRKMARKGDDYTSEISEYCEWLRKVASDYIKRLLESNPSDPRSYVAQSRLWMWQTRSLFMLGIDADLVYTENKCASMNGGTEESVDNTPAAIAAINAFKANILVALDDIERSLTSFVHDTLMGRVAEIRASKASVQPAAEVKPERSDEDEEVGICFSAHLPEGTVQSLKERIGKELRKNPGYKGLVYIRAAINENIIVEPSYPDVMATYPEIETKEKNYSAFLGATGKFVVDITQKNQKLLDFAQEQLQIIVTKGKSEG